MHVEEPAVLSWTILYKLMSFQESDSAVFPGKLQVHFNFSLHFFIVS